MGQEQSSKVQYLTGSSSSGSLEVTEILESATKISDTDIVVEEEEDSSEEVSTEEEAAAVDDDSAGTLSGSWPNPPNVQSTAEQLAVEAIQNAARRTEQVS